MGVTRGTILGPHKYDYSILGIYVRVLLCMETATCIRMEDHLEICGLAHVQNPFMLFLQITLVL